MMLSVGRLALLQNERFVKSRSFLLNDIYLSVLLLALMLGLLMVVVLAMQWVIHLG